MYITLFSGMMILLSRKSRYNQKYSHILHSTPIKSKDTLTATDGGILLPDQSKERPTEGLVVASGPGKVHPFTGVRIHNPIKEGVSVLYGKFDGKVREQRAERERRCMPNFFIGLCLTVGFPVFFHHGRNELSL